MCRKNIHCTDFLVFFQFKLFAEYGLNLQTKLIDLMFLFHMSFV